jgi:hypothetical protein
VTVTLAVSPDTRSAVALLQDVPVKGVPYEIVEVPVPNAIEKVRLDEVRPGAAFMTAALVVAHGSEVEPRLIESACAPVFVAEVSVSSLLNATAKYADAMRSNSSIGTPMANSVIAWPGSSRRRNLPNLFFIHHPSVPFCEGNGPRYLYLYLPHVARVKNR